MGFHIFYSVERVEERVREDRKRMFFPHFTHFPQRDGAALSNAFLPL